MREKLPDRRQTETFDVVWQVREGGKPFVITIGVGRRRTGQIIELFCTAGKSGDALESAARDCAIVTSIALQNGASLTEITAALTYETDGKPSSMAGAILVAARKYERESS